MVQSESDKEKAIRTTIERHLDPAEELLAFTQGHIVGLISRKPYLVGLTARRLILLMVRKGKPENRAISIRLPSINSIKWSSGLFNRVEIGIDRDQLNFRFGSIFSFGRTVWVKRARELTELVEKQIRNHQVQEQVQLQLAQQRALAVDAGTEPAKGKLNISPWLQADSRRRFEQAEDFKALGLSRAAFSELSKALEMETVLSLDPDLKNIHHQLLAELAAYKRVGLFFLVDAAVILLSASILVLLGGSEALPRQAYRFLATAIGLDIYLGVNLVRGRADMRSWALYWAVVRLFLITIIFLEIESTAAAWFIVLYIFMQTAFSLSIILPLTADKSQVRTRNATTAFVVGYLGPSLAFLIVAMAL